MLLTLPADSFEIVRKQDGRYGRHPRSLGFDGTYPEKPSLILRPTALRWLRLQLHEPLLRLPALRGLRRLAACG